LSFDRKAQKLPLILFPIKYVINIKAAASQLGENVEMICTISMVMMIEFKHRVYRRVNAEGSGGQPLRAQVGIAPTSSEFHSATLTVSATEVRRQPPTVTTDEKPALRAGFLFVLATSLIAVPGTCN
jgi:hypothetical protein